jgi:hypothetical protein
MDADQPLTHYQKYRETILKNNARWQKENRDRINTKVRLRAQQKKIEKEKELLLTLTKKYLFDA